MSDMILAIDQGTTGSTAAFFDLHSLSLLANAKEEFPQIYPSPGQVEHDPNAIWNSVLSAIERAKELLQHTCPGRHMGQVRAIGITNQRETVVPWHRTTGEPAGNAIVWQDRRTAKQCETLAASESTRRLINERAGLLCDPYFSGTKMAWLLNNNSTAATWAKQGLLVMGTVDAWLMYKLTGHQCVVTEHTNASRTMLYDLLAGDYSDDLMHIFGVNRGMLPEIRPSVSEFGRTKAVPGLPDNIPILGVLGDQQAALFGQNCTEPGECKITYGTGAFLLMNTGDKPIFSKDGLLTTVAIVTESKRSYALEGAAFIAGAAVQFLRDNFEWFSDSSHCEALATSQPRDENVLFVPALAGLGAPYWNPQAKGVLLGLTRGTQKAHIVRAVLESMALQNVQLLRLMKKASNLSIKSVGVDGGASRNDFLMQFQADMLRASLVRPANIETTAKGAALAARQGLDPNSSITFHEDSKEFSPIMSESQASTVVDGWLNAVDWLNRFYRSL